MDLVLGMYEVSSDIDDALELSNEKPKDLTKYTKQEMNFNNLNDAVKMDVYGQKKLNDINVSAEKYKSKKDSGFRISLPKESKEEFDEYNKAKRKHQSERCCGFCGKKSSHCYLTKSKTTNYALCRACYEYELRNGKLIPPNERRQKSKHKDHHEFCGFCGQGGNNRLIKSRITNYVLCKACYDYEFQNGKLIPLNERRQKSKHKGYIFACEFCQQANVQYTKSKKSGKSLCTKCYSYEYRNGHLIPPNERNQKPKHEKIDTNKRILKLKQKIPKMKTKVKLKKQLKVKIMSWGNKMKIQTMMLYS
jgi:hypothetical protein